MNPISNQIGQRDKQLLKERLPKPRRCILIKITNRLQSHHQFGDMGY